MKKLTLLAICALFSNSLFSQQWDGPQNFTDPISRNGKVNIGPTIGNSLVNIGGHLRLANSQENLFLGNDSPRLYFGYKEPRGNLSLDSFFTMQYLNDDQNGMTISTNPGLYIFPSFENTSLAGTIEDGHKIFYVSYLNGKLGMGTNSINQSNGDGYRLFVKDGIKTEKVKVEIAANNGWADYVFKKDYKLMSLNDLQSYINEKGHLPEVPTTEEAIANGIELKEMNILLLKKIEELTLYTLQQQKNIDDQNTRIEMLEKKINTSN
ncbi:hypothetical protein OF897_05750 [Chryseobacterium formosus]|uniref:Cell wall anchor protein n=1 Tax=Chryseobacterium formosus TaxID=1537363 RepID=A0ABT3XT45_9FLAO|nr:hypothetical protein [Chryseobacterium formosus]MCX8523419.1 hypothetical protein [Chryseobacterium formosus]